MNTILISTGWVVPGYSVTTASTNRAVSASADCVGGKIVTIAAGAIAGGLLGNDMGFLAQSRMGGISPDNSATQGPAVISGSYGTTTTMPNQQSGLSDFVVFDDTVGGVFPCPLLSIVSNTQVIVDGNVSSSGNLYFVSTKAASPKKITVTCTGTWGMATNNASVVTMPAGIYVFGDGSSPLEPFVIVRIATNISVVWE